MKIQRTDTQYISIIWI